MKVQFSRLGETIVTGAITFLARLQARLQPRSTAQAPLAQQLSQCESRLITTQRIAKLGHWEFDLHTRKITWTEQLFQIYGLDPTQPAPTYEQFQALIHPQDLPRLKVGIARAITEHIPYEIEHRVVRPDGAIRYVLGRGEVVLGTNGKASKLVGIAQDQTTAKLTEIALRKSEEQNRAILSAIPDIMAVIDRNGQYLSSLCNQFDGELLPLERMDLAGLRVTDIFSPELAKQYLATIRTTLETGQMQTFEQTMQFGDRRQYEEVRIVPHTATTVLCMVRNVSERKQAELNLQASEERRRLALELTGTGSWEFEVATGKAVWSDSHYHLMGLEPGTRPSDYQTWRDRVHPADLPWVEAEFHKALETQTLLNVEYRVVHPDGTVHWVLTKGQGVYNPQGQAERMLGVMMDISDRKQAEAALQESQRFIQQIADSSPNVIYIYDIAQQRNIYVNKEVQVFLGYTPEEVAAQVAQSIATLMHPDDLSRAMQHFEQIATLPDGEITEFEYRMQHKTGEWRWFSSRDTVFKRDAEGRVYQILGNAQDITDRKQAEVQLQQSETRFRQLAETVREGFFAFETESLQYSYVNPAYKAILGISPDAIVAPGDWLEGVHPVDRAWVEAGLQHELQGEAFDKEYRFIRPDGQLRWLRCQAFPIVSATQTVERIVGVAEDITERKRAEAQLESQNSLLARIAKGEALFEVLALLVQQAERHLYGALCSVLLVDGDRLRQGAVASLPAAYIQAVEGVKFGEGVGACGTAVSRNEIVITTDITTDPNWREFREIALRFNLRACWSHPITASDGQVLGTFEVYYAEARSPQPNELDVMAQMANIAGIAIEREQAEVALRQSEAKNRAMLAAIPDLILRVKGDGTCLDFIPPVSALQPGFIPVHQHLAEVLPPVHLQHQLAQMEQARATNELQVWEQQMTRFGVMCHEEVRLVHCEDEEFVIIVRDVTERKQAELALQKAEERYSLATRAAKVGVWEWNLQTQEFYLDPNIKALLGYTDAEIPNVIDRWVEYIHPADRAAVIAAAQDYLEGKTNEYVFEHRMLHKNGSIVWILVRGELFCDAEGKPERLLGTDTDITARKRAEAALQESEARFRGIFNSTYQFIGLFSLDGRFIAANETALSFGGLHQTDIVGQLCWETPWFEGLPASQRQIQQAMPRAAQGEVTQFEFQVTNRNGVVLDLDASLKPLLDENGQICQILGEGRNITDRKRAEQALQEREAQYRAIVEDQTELICRFLPNGTLTFVNQAYCRYFGRTQAELVGENFLSLLPANEQAGVEQAFSQITVENPVKTYEHQVLLPNGTRRWQHWTDHGLFDEQGQLITIQSVGRDIHDRKQTEIALRNLVAGTTGATADQFFTNLVRHLVEALDVAQAIVTRYRAGQFQTLAFWANGQFAPNLSYSLEEASACALVIQQGKYCCPQDVLHAHPNNPHLTNLQAESYWGIALTNQAGDVIGHLCIVDTKPIADPERVDSILTLFATRAAAELERQKATQALQKLNEKLEQRVYQRTQELVRSEQDLRTIFNNVYDAIFIHAMDGTIIDVNDRALELHQATRAQLLQTNIADLSDADAPFDQLPVHLQQVRAGETLRFEWPIRRFSDQAKLDTEISVRQVTLGNQLVCIAGIRDISDRKRAELALQESENRFRTLFEATPNPIQGYDQERRVIFWNRASEALYGYSHAEAIGRRVEELIMPVTSHSTILPLVDAWIAGTGDPLPNGELQLRNKAGDLLDVYSSHAMLTSLSGAKEMYCIDVDLRERKHLESELRQINAELERRVETRTYDLQRAMEAAETANRAKSTFLANMSHELRTPLNAILGFAQLMARDQSLSAEKRQQLNIINRSGEHLLKLINDILEMSKIEAGRIQFAPNHFDLYALLDTLEDMFRLRAFEKGLHFLVDRAATLPQYVKTDENKLRQVLINLIGNAIKFTPTGHVTLQVSSQQASLTAADAAITSMLLFVIEDTGVGIDPAEIDRLFEPFVQSKQPRAFQEGTGLGLPISRQFVQLLGGELTLDSMPELGSTFTFTIPVQLVDATQVTATIPTPTIIGLAPAQPTYRLLVVEDSAPNRQLLVQLLQAVGFDVREAVNGEEAIAQWETWQPHLIWMDMRMPVLDGYEATKQIRTREAAPTTVIIALTANAFEEERAKVLQAGCNGFVRKPFREAELLETIAAHLGVHYIYATSDSSADAPPPVESFDPYIALQATSIAWRNALQQATIHLDDQQIIHLIQQLPAEQSLFAMYLQEKLDNFDLEQILNLFQTPLSPGSRLTQ